MNPDFPTYSRSNKRKPPKAVFFSASIVLFFLTFSAADSVGFVPYYIDGTAPKGVALSELPELGEKKKNEIKPPVSTLPVALPERIVISSIGLDLPVQNPSTRDINALDTILHSGPARYVDSAKLGEEGNVLIFAHSSRLPVVHNQMFKAFNRVSELAVGNVISIIGKDASGVSKTYLYVVRSVRRGDANDEVIDLSPKKGTRLTLVTCDTLTSKESRWILEADFVGVL